MIRDTAVLRGSSLPRLVLAASGVMCALLLTAVSGAQAGACGDHVSGQRVACQCGDNVVSDTLLLSSDPVVVEPCGGDGLVILAPVGSDGITLNLGGLSLLGRGRGAGIQVVHGGRLGSTIVGGSADESRAGIVGFATGIRANGRSALREIRSIDLHDNGKDGLTVHSSGVKVNDVRSESNGRHGLTVRGHGNQVTGVVANSNLHDGLRVEGSSTSLSAETNGNHRSGTVVSGRDNRLNSVSSNGNGNVGVRATGSGHGVGDLKATGNGVADVVERPGAVR